MPYDDSDVKKMIKYQTERQVGFSKSKKISDDVKQLIHGILEAKVDRRFRMRDVKDSVWLQTAYRRVRNHISHIRNAASRYYTVTVPDTEVVRPATVVHGQEVAAGSGVDRPRSRASSRHRGD